MELLPPIPSWDGLHPFIIHLPIALLLLAPLLIAVSLFVKRARGWSLAALVVMALGTAATGIAVATGYAAGERVGSAAVAVRAVLDRHEEMGESASAIFLALTLVFATLVLAPVLLRRPLARAAAVAATAIFLVLYVGGALVLVDAAQQGGRLVREFGVRAGLSPGSAAAAEREHARPVPPPHAGSERRGRD